MTDFQLPKRGRRPRQPLEVDEEGDGEDLLTRRTRTMSELKVIQANLTRLEAERDEAMKARDEAIRQAVAARWTYDEISIKAGMSSSTVGNALRRTQSGKF